MTETNMGEEDHLKHLSMLRDHWSEEIPDIIIHSDSRTNNKVRRNWFVGVISDVENALEDGEILSPEAKEAAEQLVARFTSDEWYKQKLTKEEDIQKANEWIDIILGRKIE